MELRSHHWARIGTRDEEGARHSASGEKEEWVHTEEIQTRAPSFLTSSPCASKTALGEQSDSKVPGIIVRRNDDNRDVWQIEDDGRGHCRLDQWVFHCCGDNMDFETLAAGKAPRCKSHAPVGRTPDGNGDATTLPRGRRRKCRGRDPASAVRGPTSARLKRPNCLLNVTPLSEWLCFWRKGIKT